MGEGVPVTYVGNRLVAKAAMLGGIINASTMHADYGFGTVSLPTCGYSHLNMRFSDSGFRIEPVESECRLTFRQGFRSRQRLSKSVGQQVAAKAREMPETTQIFNLWIEMTHAA